MSFNSYAVEFVDSLTDSDRRRFIEYVGWDRVMQIILGHDDWLHFEEVMEICDELEIDYFNDQDDEEE